MVEGKRGEGSVKHSRERGWPWQSCNRAGAGCGGSCQAGQAGSSLAGRMASPGGLPLQKQVEESTRVSQPRKRAQQEEQGVGKKG